MKNGGIRTRPNDCAGANHMIVLAIDPVLGSDRGIAQEADEALRSQHLLGVEGKICRRLLASGVRAALASRE